MSINRLRQLGAGSKPQPNPVDEDWGAGWGDSEEDLDFGNDWDKGKGGEPGTGGYNDPDIGESDDFDDFGAKEANIKNLDDDTPPEIDQNVGADDEDDSDMDGLGFDLQEAITEGKRAAVVDEKKLKDDLKLKVAEEEARIKQKEDEIIARRISERAKEEEENRKNRQKAELEQIKNSIRDRVEVSMSRNKGSTIEKGSRDESKGGASEDLEAFLGQLDNKKDKPKDSFQYDGSSIGNNPIDDNKSFEEFEVAEKFAELDQDEP